MGEGGPSKPWWQCRRTLLAAYTLTLLFVLGMWGGADVAAAMSTVVLAVAGANASQAVFEKRPLRINANEHPSPPPPSV